MVASWNPKSERREGARRHMVPKSGAEIQEREVPLWRFSTLINDDWNRAERGREQWIPAVPRASAAVEAFGVGSFSAPDWVGSLKVSRELDLRPESLAAGPSEAAGWEAWRRPCRMSVPGRSHGCSL